MSQKIYSDLDVKGTATINSIPSATLDTDKFLVSDGGLIKYRTGNELLSDLGIGAGLPTAKVQHVVKAAVAINKGQAIYISGSDGTNMLASLASNNSEATSSKTMGLLDATVAINGFANVVTEGLLAGLNTSTAVIGDPVWLGTNGNLIYGLIGKPYAPAHLVFIGIVTRVNISNGEIFVKVQNGFELDEIHDIDLKTTVPVNGHILGFNGTLWVNNTIAGWLGYTPADDANVVHKTGNEVINGIKTFNATPLMNSGIVNFTDLDLTGNIMQIYANTNKWQFSNTTGNKLLDFNNSTISFFKTNSIVADISNSLLTASRTYSLPNISGVIALTSDVSALGALKQDKLTGPGFVKANSGVITYDNSTYLTSAVTTFSGGTTGLFPSTASSGIITLGGTLAIANGGTGATTAPLARTSLGATIVGSNIFTAANPNAITFLRANANNTVSFLDAAAFRTAIGVSAGGTITLSAIGTAPNANAATLTGTILNLQPADATYGGVVTTLPQTFSGAKTFVEDLVVNTITVGRGGAIGSTAVNTTAIGFNALQFNNANNSTAIGANALSNNVGGYQNTAIGANALQTNVGQASSAIPGVSYIGVYNTAVGYEALKLNISNNNTAVGIGTLASNTMGFQNTAVGSEALRNNTDGEENTAVGKDALRNNNDANWNTAVGSSALSSNFGGFQNTAVGRFASLSNSSGAYNTSIGVDSLKNSTISNYNTGLGYKAGYTVTGARNTFLGSQDDLLTSPQVATVDNSIAIGYNAYTTKNNQVVIGNSLITETVLQGVIKLTTSPTTSPGSYQILTINTVGGPNIGRIESVPSSSLNFLPLVGGNMTGNINWLAQSTSGLNWTNDSDSASIKFYSTGDADPNTRLEFNITDNNTEYFRWTTTPSGNALYELMRLAPTALGTGNAILTISGKVLANSFEKSGGNNNQILAAGGGIITAGTNITITGGTISSTGGSTLSMGGISATANANGATITGSVLNLAAANPTNGGVVTSGNQTFSTGKKFTDNLQITTTTSSASLGFDSNGTTTGTIICNSSFYQFQAINSSGWLFKNSAGNVNSLALDQSGTAQFAGNVYADFYGLPDVNGYSTGISSNSDRTIQLQVGGGTALNIATNNNATFTGSVTATGFFNSSDARLKDIIEQDGDTVKFTWKDGQDNKIHIGYIAQEVQKKYPDQVSEDTNGMLTVNYIEVLVAKIQELENRIKQLEK